MGDNDRLVRVAPNNLATTGLATGTTFFQVLPDQDGAAPPPTPYRVRLDDRAVAEDTSGDDGVIPLPIAVGATTALDVSGTTYSIDIGPAVSAGLGMGLHNLAFNDLSWLTSTTSRAYWSPLVPLPGVVLERSLDQLPRDLTTRLATYLKNRPPGEPEGTWLKYQPDPNAPKMVPLTTRDLSRIDGLVTRYNADSTSLRPSELQLLREAVRLHVDGATSKTPFASYSLPNMPDKRVAWADQVAYRVRVRVDRSQALDISHPNDFNQGAFALTNPGEAEVVVVGDQTGRIVSVISSKALGDGTAIVEKTFYNAGAIRWAGRIVIVAGLAYSGYRIAAADARNRPRVIGEEVGGQLGGFAGAATAGALCLGFGIATGGAGLFACGLIGGIIGGLGGSTLGSAAAAR